MEIAKYPLGAVERTPYRLVQARQQSMMSPTSKDQPRDGQRGGGMADTRDSAAPRESPQPNEANTAPTGAAAFTSETCIGDQPALEPEPARGVPVFVMLPLDTVREAGVT